MGGAIGGEPPITHPKSIKQNQPTLSAEANATLLFLWPQSAGQEREICFVCLLGLPRPDCGLGAALLSLHFTDAKLIEINSLAVPLRSFALFVVFCSSDCFRWFARLFSGLVAWGLPPPITRQKEEQLNQPKSILPQRTKAAHHSTINLFHFI